MNTTSLRETTEELERSRRQVDQLQNQLNEEKQKRQELERLVEELLARLGPQSNN
jgi:chromosome segregation ATPase